MSCSRKCRSDKKKFDNLKRLKGACQFCFSKEHNEVNFGTIFEKEDVTVHYFCMLLSSGLCQNAKVSDKKSILGFVLSDIKKELQRGARLKCSYCRNKGATIGCCSPVCRKVFHLTCGREHGTMHQFFDNFRSYCDSHRVDQVVLRDTSHQRSPSRKVCSICLSAVTSFASCDTLIPPCCQKSWFHRECMQQYALSAGMHYFKCPLCNSVKEFQAVMQTFGIYIPDQDASWESEPNAFHELLERHNTCDVSDCVCPKGRMFDASSGKFELLLCGWCGAHGSHRACKGLVWRGVHFICCDCAEIMDRAEKKQHEQRDSNLLAEDKQQKDLPFRSLRSRTQQRKSFHQQELDEQSPTSSALSPNRSLMEQTLHQNQNYVTPRRRRRFLQDQPAADLNGEWENRQELSQLHAGLKWRKTAEEHLQQPVFPGPSGNEDSSHLQEDEQSLCDRERCRLKLSKEVAATNGNTAFVQNKKYVNIEERGMQHFDCRVVLRKIDSGRTSTLLGWKSSNYCDNEQNKTLIIKNIDDVDAHKFPDERATDIHIPKLLPLSDISVNNSSFEDLIFMDNVLLVSDGEGRGSHRDSSPLLDQEIICKLSPKQCNPRKHSIAISEIQTKHLSEILVLPLVDTNYTCLLQT